MKILYWSGLFWPHIGGVEVLSMQLIPELKKKGHEVIVLTSQSNSSLKSEENYCGIKIYRIPFHEAIFKNDLKKIKEIAQMVVQLKKEFHPDIIHLNSIDSSIYFHLVSDEMYEKAPTLFTVHALPPNKNDKNTLLKKMLYSAKWITTASKYMLKVINQLSTENVTRTSQIYYGLKTPKIEPAELIFDSPRLLCIGRIVWEKGFDIMLDAFTQIIKMYPKARLIFAGDGPAKTDLIERSTETGISSAIDFLGWIHPDNVYELINTSTIVVIPSRWDEPFGLVALQAAHLSRPVIASRTGGLPEIIEDQETGLLFEKENTNDLVEKISYLLENPGIAVSFGQAARVQSEEKFCFDRYVNEYDELYNRLIY